MSSSKFERLPVLRRGDAVALLAVSSHQLAGQEPLVEKAVALLESWGLRVVIQPQVVQKHFYLAGTDAQRAQALIEAYQNPEVRALFFTRGGYGAARLLPALQEASLPKNSKIVLGLSDLTTLLVYFQQLAGMVVFHGPCLATSTFWESPQHEATHQSLYQTLFVGGYCPEIPVKILNPGRIRGALVGGCLSLLVSTLGTASAFETEDKILFLEDVNEAPYRIDRMLTHLRNAGKFEHIRGLVFAEMVGCEGKEGMLWAMLQDFFAGASFPIVAGVPSGHGPMSLTLPLGVEVELDAQRGYLRFLEGGTF